MHVGALVVDAATGDTLYARNAARRFVPASNQKLLTTIAALERMGPEYRFRTGFEAVGALGPEGILVGDLVVRGTGDPSLSERYHDDAEAPLREVAMRLREAGLRRVRGDLVIDAAEWDADGIEETWMWGDLPFGYAAVGGPFVVSEGIARVEASAGRVGDPVIVRWWPVGDPDRFLSSARSVAPDDTVRLSARVRGDGVGVEVTGGLAASTTDTLELSVQDPTLESGHVFRRVLGDVGIPVDGEILVRHEPTSKGTVLATLESPPLMALVEDVLEPSQNWMADQLLRHLAILEGDRATWRDATRAVRRILQSDFGLDSLDIDVRDGSGLSAYNLVTPRAVVSLLVQVHRRPWAARYARALAEPGEEDSTLERRLDGLQGRVFAKTGTITHANSLSGYLDTADGRRLAFAFLTNGSGLRSAEVRRVLDDAVRVLAEGR